jgi:hypothetical protein
MGGSTPTSSSLGPATTSEGGGHPHAGRAPAGGKPSSRTRTTGQQHTAEEEVYGGMDTQQREWCVLWALCRMHVHGWRGGCCWANVAGR